MHNVAVVATGSAGAQAITMAFSPIITRLYGPEAFGLSGTFMAVVRVVAPIAALSYPFAIVLPRENNDAKGIASLSARIAFFITTLIFLVLPFADDWLIGLLRIQLIASFILLIPLVMLFTALMQIAEQWLIRKKEFILTARAMVLQSFIVNLAKSGIGLFKPVAASLILLATFGNAIHGALLVLAIKTKPKNSNFAEKRSVQEKGFWTVAKKYYDFPLYRTPQALINAFSQGFPVLFLAAFFGPVPAGFYALGRTVLGMPSLVIAKSVGDVFYPRITEASHRGENLTRLILKATLTLAVMGFLPFALIVAFGPALFGFVFGREWVLAGEYSRWLAIMMFFFFILRPSFVAVPTLGLQRGLLIYEVVSTSSKLAVLYIAYMLFEDDLLTISLFCIFGSILYILLIIWVLLSSDLRKTRHKNDL